MAKNKLIYQVEDKKINERLRFYQDLSIELCSEHGKSVSFWSLGVYLLHNAIITQKRKQKCIFFSFLARKSASAIFFILSTAAAIITQTNIITNIMESLLYRYVLL